MRTNKAILDEAARSVRRTFIGSIAGSLGMLAVVGAAGAYGMPERLTAQALTAAIATFNTKFGSTAERAARAPDREKTFAENLTQRISATDAAPMSEPAESVVVTLPERAPPAAVVVTLPEPLAETPRVAEIVAAAPIAPPAIVAAEAAPPEPVAPEPAPAVTASVMPRVMPEVASEHPVVSAMLVFETPKPDDIPPLTAMPQTEAVAAPAAPAPRAAVETKPAPAVAAVAPTVVPAATPAPQAARPEIKPEAKPVQVAALEMPNPAEFPKIVQIRLPEPKPPLTPAQRLELHGTDYDKAEKCLAQAVYFEARNEPARGQEAVAQVVLNRVFSPYYPKDVCSVVYQNAHRHLSCQFTFACDGKPEAIRERGAWARATRIAKQTLDAKIWLPAVNKATHYHAAYVHPAWVRDMRVMVRYGLHTFYRPRNWGDGSNEPSWGAGAVGAKKGRAS